jgi:hypothetical protein
MNEAGADAAAAAQSVPIPPGKDTAPAKWSTADQSRTARPEWSSDGSFAPQLPESDKKGLFEGTRDSPAQSPSQASDPVLMICRIEYKGFPDGGLKGLFGASAPDLNVHLEAPNLPALATYGPEDSHVTFMTVPLLTLASTDSLVFHLRDRDADSVEVLGTVTLPAARFPIEHEQGLTAIDCRLMAKARVEQLATEQLRNVDKELAEIGAPAPIDPSNDTFGLKPLRWRMRDAITRIAAVTGWADARVARRIEWMSNIELRLRREIGDYIQRKSSEPLHSTMVYHAWGNYQVKVVDFDCRADTVKAAHTLSKVDTLKGGVPIGCVLRLHAKNTGTEALGSNIDSGNGWNLMIARSDGELKPCKFMAFEGPEVTNEPGSDSRVIAPGASATIVMGFAADTWPRESQPAITPKLVFMTPFRSPSPAMLTLEGRLVDGRANGEGQGSSR